MRMCGLHLTRLACSASKVVHTLYEGSGIDRKRHTWLKAATSISCLIAKGPVSAWQRFSDAATLCLLRRLLAALLPADDPEIL